MICLDTNIYIYAFCNNVDNQEQKFLSQRILKENKKSIVENLQFLSKYKYHSPDISDTVINLLEKKSVFKDSFDVYHICFSNYYNCSELITFDSGFKKFKDFSITNIKVL